MAPRKSERILNLTICLLAAGRYLSREQIRAAVLDFLRDVTKVFRRQDGGELKALGPIDLDLGQGEFRANAVVTGWFPEGFADLYVMHKKGERAFLGELMANSRNF